MSRTFTSILMLALHLFISSEAGNVTSSPQFTAVFCFGDSLSDSGNNNYLASLARANYAPYGLDFEGPSGRFCNGKTAVDYICDFTGNPILPAYLNPSTTGKSLLRGVNYASGAAGILDESGLNLGERISLSQQVASFKNTLKQLRRQMRAEKLRTYLAKALVVISIGSNDYINNYLHPFYITCYTYTPEAYADLLINSYTKKILALHKLGLRKFYLAGIGPLGCTPNQLANNLLPPGKCVDQTNNVVGMFNSRLVSLVDKLNSKNNGTSVFAYGNVFGAFSEILSNATIYGFNVTDFGCCGVGRNNGELTCLPFTLPCANRSQYVFWDPFHPTEAVNRIWAKRAYSGSTSDCYPVNIQQMSLM